MLYLVKLLGLANANNDSGAHVNFVAWYRRILSEGTKLISLAILTGMAASALMLTAFFAAYLALRLYAAMSPLEAIGIVAGLALIATCSLVLVTMERLRQFKEMPPKLHPAPTDIFSQAGAVADSFMEGLRTPTPKHDGQQNGQGGHAQWR